jgi:hypothetical protein
LVVGFEDEESSHFLFRLLPAALLLLLLWGSLVGVLEIMLLLYRSCLTASAAAALAFIVPMTQGTLSSLPPHHFMFC